MSAAALQRLQALVAQLRDPEHGCPWDRAQTPASLAPYALEEACEVADAIAAGDRAGLREELGDLLLQVLLQAQLAQEQGDFDLDAVMDGLADKLVRRHPHVFETPGATPPAGQWDAIKAAEQAAAGTLRSSALDGVPNGLPALARAARIQRRAAKVGFDWRELAPVLAQVRAELDELEQAISGADPAAISDELGDVLFSVANLSRHVQTDPEQALRAATHKFERRFRQVEALSPAPLSALDEAELERLWQQAKQLLRSQGDC